MKITHKSQLQYRIQHILFIVLLLACIGVAGWLSNEYNVRSDWTAGKRHSLSNSTIELLKQLPFAVKLRSYQTENPTLINAITEILNRYKNNKSDFSFEIINPDIFIKQAKEDNISQYGQTIIEYNGQTERFDNLSEESISNALIRLQRNNKPALLFLSQHGERNINDNSPAGYKLLAQKLINKGFNVKSFNLISQTLSTENTVLVLGSINSPLLESEQQKIKQYIHNGGAILWLQDPTPDDSQMNLLNVLNIHFINGVVVDNNQEVNRMLQLSHPAVIPVLEYKRHPITNKMQNFTLFTTAAAISNYQVSEKNEWLTTQLLITSETSWVETGDFINNIEFNKEKDMRGPLSIGIAQQRQIKTAEQNTSQRVVVIGDTNFIANNNLGHGANLDFILNTFNWLTNNNQLISIAPKNAPDLKLNLSAPAAAVLALTFLIALPLLFFVSGAVIWFKRNKY
ncbi:hypothetical protein MNBD_GAMMA08-326 [hydrothermal vent metagenome]|uniref:Uncharacterized protein n=1 Tax=hydrothermal vent metagenome TaxID=652676 RepID=A0A3B0XKG0_9ZZZZ